MRTSRFDPYVAHAIAACKAEGHSELKLLGQNLDQLPDAIADLSHLKSLDLGGNRFTSLPPALLNLQNLEVLKLHRNAISLVPDELAKLRSLRSLSLAHNNLTIFPTVARKLPHLEFLDVRSNKLRAIPDQIAEFVSLRVLDLSDNQILSLPATIGLLQQLQALDVNRNLLRALPPELCQLPALREIYADDNPLLSPSIEIVEHGRDAILSFLRQQLASGVGRQWRSKMMVVGEGGVGKTSLVRSLLSKAFDPNESTTHGIAIQQLELQHPNDSNVNMTLSLWDFGGQEIYHATHQFFLTNRSLFVVVWNARLGYEQGRLYYWLDTIRARAPESPVLIVATYVDERDANLPLSDLQRKYPQIIGHYAISNRTGIGIEALRTELAKVAAALPLMGESWPSSWIAAAARIKKNPSKHTTPSEIWLTMAKEKVSRNDARVLAQWLHDLGEILLFQNEPDLSEFAILDPAWLSAVISRVLDSDDVSRNHGVFSRTHMNRVWADIPEHIRENLLRLMERFDLSYRTMEREELCLVVERLSYNPPDYSSQWTAPVAQGHLNRLSIHYALDIALPPGIPTWFIARSHRFSTKTHWRFGALLSDSIDRRNVALLQAYPHDRRISLDVRGPLPHHLFSILRDTLELTLGRYPGLKVSRQIPCPGHRGEPCPHEFDLAHLERAVAASPPKYDIQCPHSFENVSVARLLFGVQFGSTDAIVQAQFVSIREELEKISGSQADLIALMHREFLNSFRREQARSETYCPNVFALRPREAKSWLDDLRYLEEIELHLYCQAPGQWHPCNGEHGPYVVRKPYPIVEALGPYIRRLVGVLKFAAPLVTAWYGTARWEQANVYDEAVKENLKLMEELVKKLPETEARDAGEESIDAASGALEPGLSMLSGAPLRGLRHLLEDLDPSRRWGGLERVVTPDGTALWLCEDHRRQFLSRAA